MKSYIYVQILLIIIQTLLRMNLAQSRRCQYPLRPNDIQWKQLEGKTFYQTLNDGDAVSRDVACTKIYDITPVENGFKLILEKYLFRSLENPDVVRLHANKVKGGFYMLDKSIEPAMLYDIVEENGEINENAVLENTVVMFGDLEFQLTDYENYFIVVRCSKEGRWYLRPHTRSPVPNAEDVLRIWRALYKNGINQPLFMSHCSDVLQFNTLE
ncbi:uncharacterized protein LOC120326713 isoform X1 [Styela clava]